MKEGQGWARRVTLENLPSFADYLRSAEEREANQRQFAEQVKKQNRKGRASSPFQGVAFHVPNRFSNKSKPSGPRKKISQQTIKPKSSTVRPAVGPKGMLLWRKRLNRSDAQQTSEGTNPTGCLRFTQARKDNPNPIDQTDFFRNQLFRRFEWAPIKANPYEEAAKVPFHLTIKGKPLGAFELQIRHKPSGEAGQGNYTTSLHWGKKLTARIRKRVSPGSMFALYAPAEGAQSPFFIEIS